MGTDMHVALEVKRNEYSYVAKTAKPKWNFIKSWTVDRCYDLFGCFGNIRRMWSNSLALRVADDMSYEMTDRSKKYYYGFYVVTPDTLKEKVLGWSPSQKDWDDEEEGYERPEIDKEWFFDMNVYLGDDVDYEDPLNYYIYKLMIKKYGKQNVRLIVYFDS